MARLPEPGGDAGNWGEILNDFLRREHNDDGTLRNVARSEDLRSPASVVVAASDSRRNNADFVCNGTDDHITINSAIAALPLNGGRVLLMAGSYNIRAAIHITRPNVALVGEGFGFWDGFAGGNPATSVEGQGMTKIRGEGDITLVHLDGSGLAGGVDNRLKGIEIRSLYLFGDNYQGTGIYAGDANRAVDQLVIEQVFVHKTNNGMDIVADAPHLQRNTIMDVNGFGLRLGNATGGIYGYAGDNVIADIGGDGIVITTDHEGAIVVANTIVRCNIGINNSANETVIQGNMVDFNRSHGIFSLRRAQIIANSVRRNTGRGIWTFSEAFGCVVSNNYVAASGGSNSCIRIQNTNDSLITGNVVIVTSGGGPGIELLNALANVVTNNRIRMYAGTSTGKGLSADDASIPLVATTNLVTGNFATKIDLPVHDGTTVVAQNNLAA